MFLTVIIMVECWVIMNMAAQTRECLWHNRCLNAIMTRSFFVLLVVYLRISAADLSKRIQNLGTSSQILALL